MRSVIDDRLMFLGQDRYLYALGTERPFGEERVGTRGGIEDFAVGRMRRGVVGLSTGGEVFGVVEGEEAEGIMGNSGRVELPKRAEVWCSIGMGTGKALVTGWSKSEEGNYLYLVSKGAVRTELFVPCGGYNCPIIYPVYLDRPDCKLWVLGRNFRYVDIVREKGGKLELWQSKDSTLYTPGPNICWVKEINGHVLLGMRGVIRRLNIPFE